MALRNSLKLVRGLRKQISDVVDASQRRMQHTLGPSRR
jgi:hypothetical protein